MGNVMGFMGKGLPSTQMLNFLLGTLHKQFTEKEIKNFDEFHIAILNIVNAFNSALPGKHYDVPSRWEVELFFKKWNEAEESNKRQIFMDFVKEKIKMTQMDNITMITGIATPPAAMAAKRAGEKLPHIGFIKAIPDVVFVPSVTIAAIITSKLSRRILMQNLAT